MPGLISAQEAVGVRQALALFLVHTATVTATEVPTVPPTVDDWGNPITVDGTPVANVPCKYKAQDSVNVGDVVFGPSGVVTRRVPTLTVAHDLPVTVNDEVSAITDSTGTVLLAGPAIVEAIIPSAGLGPVLNKKLVLRASGTVT